MSQHTRVTDPATAESEGDTLIVWDDRVVDGRVLAFVGRYTTSTGNEEEVLIAQGTLSYEISKKFTEGDEGRFRVTKKKEKHGAIYHVQVLIDYRTKHAIEAGAVFEGEGDLREGEGTGKWEWIPVPKKK